MTRLRNLVVDFGFGTGMPFWILNTILATPQLSSIQFGPSICLCIEDDPSFPTQLHLAGPVAALTSFRRPVRTHERYSRSPDEADLLSCLFEQIHHSLEVVEMPGDTAPLEVFAANNWPHLRELILFGGPLRSFDAFVVDFFARMPNLCILKLETAHLSEADLQRLCPPRWIGECPWPNLEVLTVSYPHPDDEIYTHLPETLRQLTFRCFPRHYMALEPERSGEGWFIRSRGWTSPLHSSTTMLRILRRCSPSLSNLRHLDIEFEASGDDSRLLRHISSAFPSLTFLQLLRYHKGSEPFTVSLADLGSALAPLSNLRLLRVHLDREHADNKETTEEFELLVQPLSPTVRFLCILERRRGYNWWQPYHVIRDANSGVSVRLEHTDEYEYIDGYSISGESSPPSLPRRGGRRRR